MTKKERYERIPSPLTKPHDMSVNTWKTVKKRGWYCPNYMKKGVRGTIQLYDSDIRKDCHKGKLRHINYGEEDYLSPLFDENNLYNELSNFVKKAIFLYFKRYKLTWDYVQKNNPGLELNDIIHEGIVRIFEVRSDIKGKNNKTFFLYVATNFCGSYIKSLKKHNILSLDYMREIKSKEMRYLE